MYESDIFERLELVTLDYRFLLRPAKETASDIVLIDMEDESIKAIGRWPWPRKWHAALVKAISEQSPKLIAFDVIFSEPQDELDDAAFEQAIEESGVVYLPLFYNLETQDPSLLYLGRGIDSVYEPLPRFRKWIKGTGHIIAIPDTDGVLRRVVPFVDYNGETTYQFGFKMGCDLMGVVVEDIGFDSKNRLILLKRPGEKTIRVPLDRNNQLIINWRGRWGKAFKHYAYKDVIKSYAAEREGGDPPINLGVFKNKICIIGLTAMALMDIKPVPIERAYPAVGVHAMIIANILNDDFVKEASGNFNKFLIFLVSVGMTMWLFKVRPLTGLFLAIASILGYAAIAILVFDVFKLAIVTFYPILAVIASYGLTTAYTQALQSIERTHLVKQATHDELTGLYNLRYFNLLLETEFRHTSIHRHRRFSVVMSDVDNFKEINDSYGHQAGDAVLREIARIVQSKCRQTDVVARYGGEEIVLMLVGTNEENAVGVAEAIRNAVANNKFRFKDEACSVTMSFGVVEFSGEKAKDQVVGKADAALYKAKQGGRNRVCVYKKNGAIETV